MFTKLTHLQWEALKIFSDFVREVHTSDWITGVESVPAPYSRRKPYGGDTREVVVWQGPRNDSHQCLRVLFVYHIHYSWNVQSLTFAGRTCHYKPLPDEVWEKEFTMAVGQDGTRVFIPAYIKHSAWVLMTREEQEKAFEEHLRA